MNGRFEVHVGFLAGDEEHARRVAEVLKRSNSRWSLSEVSEVQDHLAGKDPHNVPGTLGFLVSKTLERTEERTVRDDTAYALDLLDAVPNARLEIEFTYGEIDVSRSGRFSYPAAPDLELPSNPGSEQIPDTPQYEIHFVAEARRASALTISELEGILRAHNIAVAQTIRYQSERMRQGIERGRKLISTSYYASESDLIEAMESIREDRGFTAALRDASIAINLRPERIYACYRPLERKM